MDSLVVQKFNEYLRQAEYAFQHGFPKDGEMFLTKAHQLMPDSVTALDELLNFYNDTNNHVKIKEVLNKLRIIQNGNLTGKQHMIARQYIRRAADWEYYHEEIEWLRHHPSAECIPFYVLAMPFSEEEHLNIQREFIKANGFTKNPKLNCFSHNLNFKNRKINIGFLSANWRNHPEAFIIGELIENFNRDKFNLFLYDIDPYQKDFQYKQRIIDASHGSYLAVNKMSDFDIAKKINSDKVDILFDFHAFTYFNRINIFTFQPAPIQVSYLGYPGTVGGIQGIDYVVADSYVVPENHKEYYSEHVMYLDPCAYTYDTQCPIPKSRFTRRAFGLPNDSIILCCFCNDYKITPDYFEVWMNVLKRVPKAVLWLYSTGKEFENNIKKEAEKKGVSSSRIYFTYRQPHPEYMAKQCIADLFLDTQYYNAHTTAIEALFMNLPVITCPGDNWPSRVGGSILTALEMPELIAKDLKEYEEKIVFYANYPEELKKLKEKLNQKKNSSPFFDSKQYTHHFENMCMKMIEIYQKENGD